MTQKINLSMQSFQPVLLRKRILQGAACALVLIIVFLLQAGEPNPNWHKLWMIRPLIIVPLAGAMGGLLYHFINRLPYYSHWKKMLAILLGLFVYLITIWVGTVLGLDGTFWN